MPLPSTTTSYRYVASDCPNDGEYTIRSSSINCYNTWHTLNTDHTGNGQGNFMLVNASFAAGDFYTEKVGGLCANTTYEFAAWFLNMVRISGQIKPNITFSVELPDGTVLGSYTSGGISDTPTPQWQQAGFSFRTPANVFEVVLRMRNNAPGGIGNDVAVDDISFRACGPRLETAFSGNITAMATCQPDAKEYELASSITNFYSDPVYQWQASEDGGLTWTDIAGANGITLKVFPKTPGNYSYRMVAAEKENFSSINCRVASTISSVNIYPTPVVNAGPDKVVLTNNSVTLDATSSDAQATFQWSPAAHLDDATKLTPLAQPVSDQTYTLSATSAFGCTASDSVFIKLIKGIYIPNAFTPNGDGNNDLWQIPFLQHIPGARVQVFNRYGNLVYHSPPGASVSWNGSYNGQPQSTGIYVFVVQAPAFSKPLKGTILLLR